MVAGEFLEYISRYKVTSHVGIDDVADRFNFLFTVGILLLCTTILTIKQYLLKPISCYLANDPGGINLLEFVEYFCWVEGTIPQELNVKLPETEEEWDALENKKILYYQWIPFLLGIQCILFYLPRLIWQMVCYNRAGTDLHHLVHNANDAMHADLEQREKLVLQVAHTMERLLFQPFHKNQYRLSYFRQRCRKMCGFLALGHRTGNQLVLGYLILKLLYLTNSIGQLILFQRFLGSNVPRNKSSLFGWQVGMNIIQGRDWRSTLLFPRVTVCYARVRQMGSVNSVSAQCVLPVNMLIEKMYVFLWFWIALTSLITGYSTIKWMVELALYRNHRIFVRKHLRLGQFNVKFEGESVQQHCHKLEVIPYTEEKHAIGQEKQNEANSKLMDHFIRDFLHLDGIFLLRIMSINVGDVVTSDILCQLWWAFQKRHAGELHAAIYRNMWQRPPVTMDGCVKSMGDSQIEIPVRSQNIPLPDPPMTQIKHPVPINSVSMELQPTDAQIDSIQIHSNGLPDGAGLHPQTTPLLARRRYSSVQPSSPQHRPPTYPH